MKNDQWFGLATDKMNLCFVLDCLNVNQFNNIVFKNYYKSVIGLDR